MLLFLERLWTFVLGTKQSVRIASVNFHSFGSRIYLVHCNVCRKPGLAGLAEPGVIESENYEKPVLLDGKDNNSIDSSTEKSIATRKVSASDQKSPVKKVIKTNKISIGDKDNNSVESSTEKSVATKRISANADDIQGGEEKASSNVPPSPFQEVRVKSFEEIMQEKRKRKAECLRETAEDVSGEVTASVSGQVNSSTSAGTSIPPKRLKRIVRKSSGDSDKDAKVVSSSGAESTVSKVKPTRKRTVYVMDGASPSKDSKENGESYSISLLSSALHAFLRCLHVENF